MAITVHNLKLFVQIAEAHSFTAVAEKNFVTQSALSRMVFSMEKELGFKLIGRTTRHAELTEEGELFYRHAHRVLEDYDKTLNEIATLKKNETLRIGYNPISGPPEFLLNALDRLRERIPGASIEMTRAYSADLYRMLDNGSIDCAFVSSYYAKNPTNYHMQPMQPICMFALMRKGEKVSCVSEAFRTREIVFMAGTAPRTRERFYKMNLPECYGIREGQPAENLEDMIFRIRLNGCIGISSFSNREGIYADITALQVDAPETEEDKTYAGRAVVWRKDRKKQAVAQLCDILEELRETPGTERFPYRT